MARPTPHESADTASASLGDLLHCDQLDLNDSQGAPLTIPYEPSLEEHGGSDVFLPDSPRCIDHDCVAECLQVSEDIDFEFVYALHTFVATVEGQANATKGDTMVLLDDSNSYWWLVRVVKDSTIGMSLAPRAGFAAGANRLFCRLSTR